MSLEMYKQVYTQTKHRKDHYGRNTVLSLRYSSVGFACDKDYLDMNIHERISVRAGMCGFYYPTACVKNRIMRDRYPFLIYEDIDLFTIAANTQNRKLYEETNYL